MGRPLKFKESDILKAIKDSRGIMRTIAMKLGCEWHTAEKYVNMYESTKQAYLSEEEFFLDDAESVLKNKMEENDLAAAKYLLSTKGKRRGYTERQEITGADGRAVEIIKVQAAKPQRGQAAKDTD